MSVSSTSRGRQRARRAGGIFVFAAGYAALASLTGVKSTAQASSGLNLRTQTSVVLVPTLVRSKAGDVVFALKAEDFVVTDDGKPQKVSLEVSTDSDPLALVVVVEAGRAGAGAWDRLGSLAPMLGSIIGGVEHQVAVVSFDSQPRLIEGFTADVDEAAKAIAEQEPDCRRSGPGGACLTHATDVAENGAAILDSLTFAVDKLRQEPVRFRRAVLLISETSDRGSRTSVEEAVRSLSETDTTIYSIAFSTAKSQVTHYAYRELPTQPGQLWGSNANPNPPHGCMGKDPAPDATHNRWVQAYDCLTQLVPPLGLAKMAAIATVDGLQRNVPETVAHLTGGEYYRMTSARGVERELVAIGKHLPNRYMLSFHPSAPHQGLHSIGVSLPGYKGLEITARTEYWAQPLTPDSR